jgi:hypothetical protein
MSMFSFPIHYVVYLLRRFPREQVIKQENVLKTFASECVQNYFKKTNGISIVFYIERKLSLFLTN